jgi:hypothetical protein
VRLRLLCVALTGGAALAAPAAARQLALFPTPATPLSTAPPLVGAQLTLPNLFRPPIQSREWIAVGVDEQGSVVSVEVTQRLVLRQRADYRITIPAPVRNVEAATGSQSLPGQRQGAILWQGFAAGQRILGARARLDPVAAAPALPLRLGLSVLVAGRPLGSFTRSGELDVYLRLHNATRVSVTTFSGDGDRPTLAKILDTLRRDPGGSTLGRGTYVAINGPTRNVRMTVDAPLRVVGRLRFGAGQVDGGTMSFATVLGGARPFDRIVHLQGRAKGVRAPHLELTVSPLVPADELRPPTGRTWVETIRSDRRLTGRRLLAHALETSLRLARVRQYQTYLLNPDPLGVATASYVYRSAPKPAAPAPTHPASGGGGLGAAVIALIAVGAVLGAGGLVALWAHS